MNESILRRNIERTLLETAGYLPFTTDIIAYHDKIAVFANKNHIKQFFNKSQKFNSNLVNGKKITIGILLEMLRENGKVIIEKNACDKIKQLLNKIGHGHLLNENIANCYQIEEFEFIPVGYDTVEKLFRIEKNGSFNITETTGTFYKKNFYDAIN